MGKQRLKGAQRRIQVSGYSPMLPLEILTEGSQRRMESLRESYPRTGTAGQATVIPQPEGKPTLLQGLAGRVG
jgi:hypothetical protein